MAGAVVTIKDRNTVSVTDFKIDFNNVLNQADRDGIVFITRYNKPKYVLLQYDEYLKLTNQSEGTHDVS